MTTGSKNIRSKEKRDLSAGFFGFGFICPKGFEGKKKKIRGLIHGFMDQLTSCSSSSSSSSSSNGSSSKGSSSNGSNSDGKQEKKAAVSRENKEGKKNKSSKPPDRVIHDA